MDGRYDPEVRVDWLIVGGSTRPWEELGFAASGRFIPLAGTGLEIAGDSESGMRGWRASGVDNPVEEIDGVCTTWEAGPSPTPEVVDHPLGALSIDHVVVTTDDLSRTSDAIADALAAPSRRVRETGRVRQGFHTVGHPREGGLIIEVVERPDAAAGHASLWGFTLVVEDLDAACRQLGPDRVADPKDAVQPGRRIATLRSGVGLGVPVALMSPHRH